MTLTYTCVHDTCTCVYDTCACTCRRVVKKAIDVKPVLEVSRQCPNLRTCTCTCACSVLLRRFRAVVGF